MCADTTKLEKLEIVGSRRGVNGRPEKNAELPYDANSDGPSSRRGGRRLLPFGVRRKTGRNNNNNNNNNETTIIAAIIREMIEETRIHFMYQ